MNQESPLNSGDQPLDETGKWFRDVLMKLIGWGSATFIIMAGWLLPGGTEFSFFTGDKEDFYRAFGLLFFSTCFWLTWVVAVIKTRQMCPEHPTILKKSYVFTYAFSILGAVFLLMFLVLND